MGSAVRRKRESTETRQRILDAARELFVQNGFDATSMRAIADRIEYTPTAIYHHFQNKEALLDELCSQDFRELARSFQKIGQVEDPVERIVRAGEAYVEFGLEHPQHYQFMFMTPRPGSNDKPEASCGEDPGEDAYAFLRQAVVEAIEAGRFKSDFADPDTVAQILWGSLHGQLSLRITKGEDPWVEFREAREMTDLTCRALMDGMLR